MSTVYMFTATLARDLRNGGNNLFDLIPLTIDSEQIVY